jgi:hypothetical protein
MITSEVKTVDQIVFAWHCPECDWHGEVSLPTELGGCQGRVIGLGDPLLPGVETKQMRDVRFYESFRCPHCALVEELGEFDTYPWRELDKPTTSTRRAQGPTWYLAEVHCFGSRVAAIETCPINDDMVFEEI